MSDWSVATSWNSVGYQILHIPCNMKTYYSKNFKNIKCPCTTLIPVEILKSLDVLIKFND